MEAKLALCLEGNHAPRRDGAGGDGGRCREWGRRGFAEARDPPPRSISSASASASAPAALLPLLAVPPRFLHLPLRRPSTRRHGCGSSLLLQPPPPPGPGSRAHFRTTCCASSSDKADVQQGGTSLFSVAAFTLLAALQLVWLRWRRATHGDSPEVSLNSGHFVGCCFLCSPQVNDTYSR